MPEEFINTENHEFDMNLNINNFDNFITKIIELRKNSETDLISESDLLKIHAEVNPKSVFITINFKNTNAVWQHIIDLNLSEGE